MGRDLGKKVKFCWLRYRQFNGMEKEGLIIKELECTKQGMHSAIAHHLLIDAQLIPEQWLLASFPPSLYTDHDAICYGISL